MAKIGFWNTAKKRMLDDRGALPKEEGDLIRECKAMHEEHFLSSWLREDETVNREAKEERTWEVNALAMNVILVRIRRRKLLVSGDDIVSIGMM